jgi:hypothetical protein
MVRKRRMKDFSHFQKLDYYTGNNEYQSCHSRESGNPRQNWMPDQVRHDNLSHVYLPE